MAIKPGLVLVALLTTRPRWLGVKSMLKHALTRVLFTARMNVESILGYKRERIIVNCEVAVNGRNGEITFVFLCSVIFSFTGYMLKNLGYIEHLLALQFELCLFLVLIRCRSSFGEAVKSRRAHG